MEAMHSGLRQAGSQALPAQCRRHEHEPKPTNVRAYGYYGGANNMPLLDGDKHRRCWVVNIETQLSSTITPAAIANRRDCGLQLICSHQSDLDTLAHVSAIVHHLTGSRPAPQVSRRSPGRCEGRNSDSSRMSVGWVHLIHTRCRHA